MSVSFAIFANALYDGILQVGYVRAMFNKSSTASNDRHSFLKASECLLNQLMLPSIVEKKMMAVEFCDKFLVFEEIEKLFNAASFEKFDTKYR